MNAPKPTPRYRTRSYPGIRRAFAAGRSVAINRHGSFAALPTVPDPRLAPKTPDPKPQTPT